MSADAGKDGRDMLALQKRADRLDAEVVKRKGRVNALRRRVNALSHRVAALEDAAASPEPSAGLPVDPHMPSEDNLKAMRLRLRARTLEGIKANKKDRYRAGRTYRRESDVS